MIWTSVIVVFLLLLIWGGGYVLSVFDVTVPLAVEITASVLVLLGAVGWIIARKVMAQRRAKALEAEILRQSEQAAAAARPDRRAEILELQKRVQQGIKALQDTKVGKHHGKSALYALPWYAIIGPPGAGKTTALRQSGLVFPFQDPNGAGGVRGVGGTRNCDWWFTNEGILLDTAGRYATDDSDREEWMAFLGLLRKYRPQKPINGLLVAVSIADLFDASDEQIASYANKLRARVDEIMTRLDMVLPVYLIFTKADLIGGFVEFWGDLRKSDRDQILGATFPLDPSIGQRPGASFAAEFDRICEVIHSRALRIIGKETQGDARAKIYQFPLEFSALRGNLEQFVEELFRQNAFQENPMFRGFYVTSGTQEGAPLQRIMGNMARALGIRQVPTQAPRTEARSYFVTDVFRRVVFPDQYLAGRTASELRRQKLIRAGIAAAAVVFGSVILIPALVSLGKNRTLIKDTEAVAITAAAVNWGAPTAALGKVEMLKPARAQLALLDGYAQDGPPISMRWGMYTGETLHPALIDAYAGQLERGMASPARKKLELDLAAIGMTQSVAMNQYGRMYDQLKLYLMLTQPEHLDIEWATPRLSSLWGQLLGNQSPETLQAMAPHVQYYLELIKSGRIPKWPEDSKTVAKARSVLLRAPQLDRIYDLLVREANEHVAPIRRENIFYGSIAPYVKSKKELTVPGAYTRDGWERVRKLLGSERSRLTGEKWVLGEKEDLAEQDIEKQIKNLHRLYFERFQATWRNFLADLEVERPKDSTTSLDELNALSEPEWPYMRLLRILDENTKLALEDEPTKVESLLEKAEDKVKQKITGQAPGKEPPRPMSPAEKAFKPLTSFAMPKEGEEASATGLAQYQAILAKLVGILTDLRDSDTPTSTAEVEKEFQTAFRTVSALLAAQDGFTRPLLSPLLQRPIMGSWSGVSNDIGSAAGGLWEVSVWDAWQTTLGPKFPFAQSNTDPKLDDFVAFFAPQSGALWSFYEQNLKGSIKREGDAFVPVRRMDSKVAYDGGFLSTCLERGRKISDAFFPEGADKPRIDFQVNLHSVSPNVSQVSLTIDGVSHVYQNHPEQWLTGTWPAEEGPPGAHVRIQGADGLDEEIIREGEFGLFRLIEAATKLEEGRASGNGAGVPTLVAHYEFPSENTFLKLDIRTKQGLEVLMPELVVGYSCPRIITARTN